MREKLRLFAYGQYIVGNVFSLMRCSAVRRRNATQRNAPYLVFIRCLCRHFACFGHGRRGVVDAGKFDPPHGRGGRRLTGGCRRKFRSMRRSEGDRWSRAAATSSTSSTLDYPPPTYARSRADNNPFCVRRGAAWRGVARRRALSRRPTVFRRLLDSHVAQHLSTLPIFGCVN